LCKKETQARDFACHDELTGLPNRRLLRDRLNQAMAQGARQRKQVVLLLLDLDGFKTINDQLGHTAGDKVPQAVAERLRATIRAADTACRYGGDEFMIMLPEVDHMGLANTVTAKVVRARLSEPCIIDGYEICLAARVGTVVYPDDGETFEELIRQADSGLYGAKAGSSAASIRALPKEPLAQAGM
jgi:diguanylate cyclase